MQTANPMFAERLWDVLTGSLPVPVTRDIPIVVSILYYSITLFSGRLVRRAVTKCAPDALRLYLGDMVLSFMVHACSLENGQFRRYYGWPGFIAILFCITMWFSLNKDDYQCNPRKNVIDYVQGDMDWCTLLLRTLFQLAGGLLSYHYARAFWSLDLTYAHGERFKAHHCNTHLQVPLLVGLAVECGGSVVDTMLAITTFSNFAFAEMTTKSILAVGMTVLGVDATGFYVNPINASNQCFGCRGASALEHILVYWAGPLLVTAVTVQAKAYTITTLKLMQLSEEPLVDAPHTNVPLVEGQRTLASTLPPAQDYPWLQQAHSDPPKRPPRRRKPQY